MDKALISALLKEIKILVIQEIRLLKLKKTFTPEILIDDLLRSIHDTKREIVRLSRGIPFKERKKLLQKMLKKAINEEIDQVIKFRTNRCIRCIHGRFYDYSEIAYERLPYDYHLIKGIGCDRERISSPMKCKRFVELSSFSLEDYLNDLIFYYEFREWIDQIEEIWQEYFLI